MGRTTLQNASVAQQKALAITPKLTAAMGLISSLYIIIDVTMLPKSKRKTYHRLLMGLSVSNVFADIAWFMTTWPIPPEVLPIWGATGTQQTCTAQGFFAQLIVGTAVYYGSLALYYFLVINKGWSERQLENSRIERWIHSTALVLALGTSVAGLFLDLYNPVGWFCWIGSIPFSCRESWYHSRNPNGPDCIRGDNAHVFQWMFFYCPLWLLLFLDTVFMSFICSKFWKQERRNLRWKYAQEEKNNNKPSSLVEAFLASERLRQIVFQSLLYLLAFYISTIFSSILRVNELIENKVWYHWMLLSATFAGLNGTLVLLVYLRPRFVAVRERRRHQRRREAVAQQAQDDQRDHNLSKEGDVSALSILEGEDTPSIASIVRQESAKSAKSARPSTLEKSRSHPLLDALNDIRNTLWLGDGGLSGEALSVSTTLRASVSQEGIELPTPEQSPVSEEEAEMASD